MIRAGMIFVAGAGIADYARGTSAGADGGASGSMGQVPHRQIGGGWRALPPSFWVLLALAAGLRIAAFDLYATHHPDEALQYVEQAHRLVFGYGVVPWEFRYDIRSWLIPLLVAGPMQLGAWIDPHGAGYLIVPRGIIAMANFSPVIAAWYLGARVSRQHAIVAMAVTALWVESVYFSVQLLSESMAVACFLPAAAMLWTGALRQQMRFRMIVLAGMLLAIAGLLRFPYVPAIGVFAALTAGRDRRMWQGLLIGAIPVIVGGGAIDLAMGQLPYQWVLNNYRMNIDSGWMARFGGMGPWVYVAEMGRHLPVVSALIVTAALFAGRRFGPLLIAAWVNILVHQMIGHKEWRFLWMSIQILLVLAAIGAVNLTRMSLFGQRLKRPRGWATTGVLLVLFGGASMATAAGSYFRHEWRNDGGPSRLAARAVRDPAVCGLAVNREQNIDFGYGFVHRPIPLILLDKVALPSLSQPGATAAGFNAMLINDGVTPPAEFGSRHDCAGAGKDRVCLYTRPGGCSANATSRRFEYQAVLDRVML